MIEVWEPAKGGPGLLDRVVIPPGRPPWGDTRVAYYDPWLADRLCADVCRRHFREVMRRRIGQESLGREAFRYFLTDKGRQRLEYLDGTRRHTVSPPSILNSRSGGPDMRTKRLYSGT